MKIEDLSTTEQHALPKVLAYWVAHWDWECPTLFGLEKSDLEAVLASWPASLSSQEKTSALALIGALRELLYGASAVPKAQVPAVCGLSYAEASALAENLFPRISEVLDGKEEA
jgi:hypothetical protein